MSQINTLPLTPIDQQLIETAKELVQRKYEVDKHHLAATLLTKSGKVFTAVNMEHNVGRVDICAEGIVLGMAVSMGETELDTIVAVRHPHEDELDQEIKVVSPCGICREMMSYYQTDMKVIVVHDGVVKKCLVSELLPCKYEH